MIGTGRAVATGWSRRTADALMRRLPVLGDRWDYKWGVVAKGLLELWGTTGDRKYLDYVRRSVDRFVAPDGSIGTYEREAFSLDFVNPGKALFALLRETGDARYRAGLEILRAQLRDQPRTPSGGFWHKRMYPDQMWLDGIYMASPFLAEYAATFGEPEIYGDVVHQITLAFERTRERSGLLFHAWDESRAQPWADPLTGCSRSFWGRAIGWYAMALVDALDFLPASADRLRIESILHMTMAAVASVQDTSGSWWQVLDQGDRPGNYLEQSATCMFAYAFAKGARKGLLPASDSDTARRAYDAVVDRFVRETAEGGVDVAGCCVGTGLGGTPDRDGSFEYYAKRPVVTNDHHGVGAFLLASVEIERAG